MAGGERDPQAGIRPAPMPSGMTREFWEGAKQGKLMLQYCKDAKKFQFYPRPVSIYTGSRNLEWREVSGKGRIYACTVIRVPGPMTSIQVSRFRALRARQAASYIDSACTSTA